jgi:hypothetical protein
MSVISLGRVGFSEHCSAAWASANERRTKNKKQKHRQWTKNAKVGKKRQQWPVNGQSRKETSTMAGKRPKSERNVNNGR